MNYVSDGCPLPLGLGGLPTVSFQYFLFTGSMGTSSNSSSMHSISRDALESDEECGDINVSGMRTRDG